MDEKQVAQEPTVGEQLKAARTKQKMSLEDIAAQTRIPLRHLESIEESAWDRLPAPTYTIGFAKSYAGAVGVDRTEVGERLREELGGSRYTVTTAEVFEPADPARSMPKWLVIGAIIAVLLVVALLSWLNQRSLQGSSSEPAANTEAPATAAQKPPPLAAPIAQGPVVITPKEPVWFQVYEKGGQTFYSGIMNPGQNFKVPATAKAPLLKTGKPEGLTITVGSAVAPPVGPAGKMASDVSLVGADLLKGGATPRAGPETQATTQAASSATQAQRRPARVKPSPAIQAPAPQPAAPTETNATGG